MSDLIQQELRPLLQSLLAEIGKGNDLLLNGDSSITDVSETSEMLARKITQSRALIKDWTAILTDSDEVLRDLERVSLNSFTIDGKVPGVILNEASECQIKLDIRIDLLRPKGVRPPGGAGPDPPRAQVNLPALHLPDFDGREENWPSFWASFQHTIDQNVALTPSQKLTYLVGRLSGIARTLVDGFSLIDDNYFIVVDLLKSRFGDEKKRADKLRSELFHLPKPSTHSHSLRTFAENVDRICRQLEGLGSNLDDNPFLSVAIKEKLPTEIKGHLYDKEMSGGRAWTSKEWRERLNGVVKLKEAIHWDFGRGSVPSPPKPHPPPTNENEQFRRAFPVVQESEERKEPDPENGRKGNGKGSSQKCLFCAENTHQSLDCPIYHTGEQRKARLEDVGRCGRCTKGGHRTDQCTSMAKCFRCGDGHFAVVCPRPVQIKGANSTPLGKRQPRNGDSNGLKESDHPPANPFAEIPSLISSAVANGLPPNFSESSPLRDRPPVYLMVREVKVFNSKGPTPINVPVFFDSGSQPSFITANLANRVGAEYVEHENMSVGGFMGTGTAQPLRFSSPRFRIRLKQSNGEWFETEVNETERIIPPVEYFREILGDSDLPPGIGMTADEPQILLGIREFWKIFISKKELIPGFYRISTVLGAVYGGEAARPPSPVLSPAICGVVVSAGPRSASLDETVEKLWRLETIGITDPLSSPSQDEELAENLFEKTVQFRNGRYEVAWPWRPGGRESLPNNFSLAYCRLNSLSVKLRSNPEFREKYQATITEQLERGIIEPAKRTGGWEYYIPHQAVITPKKLRVVYDASAKLKGKPSLNDLLLPGPNLVPELAGILMRFRGALFPVLADIEKAFLAVGLKDEDREAAKFLWVRDPALPPSPGNILIYRFCRIAFGVNSSPFLLASVLRHHLRVSGDPHRMARNFYVDNLLLCSDDARSASAAVRSARLSMGRAGMHLREFVALDSAVLVDVPADDVLHGATQRVLGIPWNLERDELIFEFPKTKEFPTTRRGILGAISSLFDPLGFCSPTLLEARVFFQSLWDLKRGWDDPLDEQSVKKWVEITAKWEGLPVIVPRLTLFARSVLQLHVFTDAGPNAYAAVAFIRTENEDIIETNLIFAKSRVRPKKMAADSLTIPRLELLGLLLGVRIKNFVSENLDNPIQSVYFWVDSQIVLSWLTGTSPQPIFIANRLKEIRREKTATFKYVRSEFNPADWGTRGVRPGELNGAEFWYKGPKWLREREDSWPNEFRDIILPLEEPDVPPPEENSTILTTMPVLQGITILDPRKFSHWSKFLFRTTFVLSFLVKKIGGSPKFQEKFPDLCPLRESGPNSAEARKIAKKWILKREQGEMDPGEGEFLGEDGLIRLRTRLQRANQPGDFRNPVVLPRDSWVTRLLVFSGHSESAHAGVDYTLSTFLAEFWCPRPRRLIKRLLRDCPVCKRDRAVRFALPPMPPYPTARVQSSPPFSNVGLDYLGPTQFKAPDGPKKGWILLFTCLSVRAVHLELVDSLSSASFLSAYRRFVARRGTPERIWSDNGTQLVMGRALLMTYYESPAKWTLIPPLSPWAGGIYERMVGLVKVAFRRSLGRSIPGWDQLMTLTCEIEGILNQRPISFVSDEKDGPLPLRPIDFLAPHRKNVLIEPDEPDQIFNPSSKEKLAHSWYVTNECLRRFWKLWAREYLIILRGRTQDTHKGPRITAPESPKVGDIVLVEQEDFPRNLWPLARILSLAPGIPGKARSARILMGSGKEWERPINKLIPLEDTIWKEVEDQVQLENLDGTEESQERVMPPDATPLDGTEGEGINIAQGKTHPPVPFKWASRPPRPGEVPEGHDEGSSVDEDEDYPSGQANRVPSPSTSKSGRMAPSRLRWAQFPPLPMIVFVFCLFDIAFGATPTLSCDPKGIWVYLNPKTTHGLVCCEGICSSRSYTIPYLFPLPLDLISSGFLCHATYTLEGQKIDSQIHCDPIEGCELITCTFCWARLLNPHCSPSLVAFMVGCLVGAIGVLLSLIVCLLMIIRRRGVGFRWVGPWVRRNFGLPEICRQCFRRTRELPTVHWRRGRGPRIREVEGREEDEEEIVFDRNQLEGAPAPPPVIRRNEREDTPPGSLSPRRRGRGGGHLTRVGYALAPFLSITFLMALMFSLSLPAFGGLEVVSLMAKSEKCTEHKGHVQCSFDQTTSLTLLPMGQETELILHSSHSVPMGSLKFEIQELENVCVKEIVTYTRSYEPKIVTILRCPWAGSCSEAFCASVGTNTSVPELPKNFPGLNYCREVSGFIWRGCVSFKYACFYYRIYADPISSTPYEFFRCPTWQTQLKLGIKLDFGGESFSARVVLAPGFSQHWDRANLSISFSPSGLPPLPVLGGGFLANRNQAALAPDWIPYLKCGTFEKAARMDCTLRPESCSCHTFHESAELRCDCNKQKIEEMIAHNPIPTSLGHLSLNFLEGKLWSSYPYVPINLFIKMKDTQLAVKHAPTKCTIRAGEVKGCHSCLTGGRLNFTCSSEKGSVFASIDCLDGTNFVAKCAPPGISSSVVLSWAYPEIDTFCKVDCLGGVTIFPLKGTLMFFPRWEDDLVHVPSHILNVSHGTGIPLPQIKFALFSSLGSLPTALIVVLTGLSWVILFLVLVRYVPLAYLLGLCCPQAAIAATAVQVALPRLRQGVGGGESTRGRRGPRNGDRTRTM